MAPAHLNGGIERDDVQGLLASGYGHLPEGAYLLVRVAAPSLAAAWLGRLADEVTTAVAKPPGTAVNVALAPSALSKLGLPRAALAGFSDRFLEGMTAPFRSRALGDVDQDAPGRWVWGGPDAPPVDLLLLLYGETRPALAGLEQRLVGDGRRDGLEVVRRLEGELSDREHFGFRDGISQPAIEGLRSGPPADTIKPGEFVLGYRNEYGNLTDRPLVARSADPGHLLAADPAGSGRGDLGRNGTYLVFRQLSQDVRAFWAFVDEATSGADDRDAARTELAAKMVGRWPDGAPLALAPESPDQASADANEFGYHHTDPYGTGCPIGAHVRRTHPRDSLDPRPGSERSVAVDKRHRILRRGRRYGVPVTREEALDGPVGDDERGIHFICLCANIARQFEFVQHTWVNNPKFDGLYDDADPLLGRPGRTFTVQAAPVRRRVTGLPSFTRTRGGGYFFLPGVRAIRYLATLAPSRP